MSTLKIQLRWALPLWLIGVLTNWLPDNRITIKVRGSLAKPFIKSCGRNFQLGAHVTLLNTQNLEIGDNVYIARGTWLNCMGELELEDEVILAPYVVISTLQHVFKNNSVRFGGSISGKVLIKQGTWLAAHVTVKQGVTIGKGNLIASNASVVKNTEDYSVMGGVPAKKISINQDGEAEFHTRNEYIKRGKIDL